MYMNVKMRRLSTRQMDRETLLRKCKESMEDIVGWKVFIFFPQNFIWRFFILITVLTAYGINSADFFYLESHRGLKEKLDLIEFACDSFYLLDTISATLHYAMFNTRKLRHGRKRHILFLFIDYLSLIPFNLIYRNLMYNNGHDWEQLYDFLRINAALRMYQIYMCFYDVKFQIYKGKIYFLVNFIEILIYMLALTHTFSCFLVYDFEEKEREICRNDLFTCILENEVTTFYLLSQGFVQPVSGYKILNHKSIVILDFIVGYIFTYGYVAPMLVFASLKYLRGYFEFSNRLKQLNLFVNNVVEDKKLREEILEYFQHIWIFGKGARHPEILEVFPLAYRKSMFCDVHWEAFRHSDFFQGISLGSKRALALYMRTDFVPNNSTVIKKGEIKQFFIFLESGMMQLMAEENSNFPVISFSSGTILGESSFFFSTNSLAELRTAKFSIIHFLRFRDLFRVMLDYPKDMNLIFKRVKLRLKIAKSTQTRKLKICPKFIPDESTYTMMNKKRQADIKWLKQQYRTLIELHRASLEPQDANQDAIFAYRKLQQNLKSQLEHTSVYLSLLSISDEVVNMQGVVCLKMSFPCFVDPQSNFLVIWDRIVIFTVFLCTLLYPVILAWFEFVPDWFADVAAVVNAVYIIDVLIQLLTAIKIKNVVITKVRAVFMARVTSLAFCFDVLAAIPISVAVYFMENSNTPFIVNFYFANALLKSYKVFLFLGKWNYSYSTQPLIRTYVKYSIILFIGVYWMAAYLNLSGVECAFGSCTDDDWYALFEREKGREFEEYVSVYMSVFISLDIPYELLRTQEAGSYIAFFVAFIYFRMLFFAWQTECTSAYVLEHSHKLNYENLMELVLNFMQSRHIVLGVQKRVMKTMQFQWDFDYGNFITQKHRIMDDLDLKLKEGIDKQSVIPTLASSMLFDSEEEDIFPDLCRRVNRLALPANSLLITFGTQTMSLYVVHKGYVQLNSFLPGDLIQNVGTPIVMKSGSVFPVIVAFNQRPAAVSARTITDCELLILNLEDILATMMIFGLFKDVIEATKGTNLRSLSAAKLGFTKVEDVFKLDKREFNSPFKKLPAFFRIIKYIFIRKTIHSNSGWFIKYEIVRVIMIICCLFLWPAALGRHHGVTYTFPTPLLIFVESFAYIDFYIKLHLAYYNSKGIYVTHPISTSKHYLATTFVSDCLAFSPNYHLIYCMSNLHIHLGMSGRVLHFALRAINLYRFLGVARYLKERKIIYHVNIFKYVIITASVLNAYVYLILYRSSRQGTGLQDNYSFTPNNTIKKPDSRPVEYFLELSMILFIMMKIQFFFHGITVFNVIHITTLAVFGWLAQIYLYSFLTLNSMSSNLNFTIYQYYMQSFEKYLTNEKAEDSICNVALAHFEHEWEKKKGEDLHKIFSHFPAILHEDLMYPLYKKTLSAVPCLAGANVAFYRSLSRHMFEVHLKKGSLVIFENQVQEDIFFIHKGQCSVNKSGKTLYVGSMIGDIHGEGLMKNTIVAGTHVDILKIPSKIFFTTMSNFYHTEKAFKGEVRDVEDFVESIYIGIKEEEEFVDKSSKDIPESEFEVVDDNVRENAKRVAHKSIRTRIAEKFIFYPSSKKIRYLNAVFLWNAYVTITLLPIIIVLGLLTVWSLFIIYAMDFVWVVKIIVQFRTVYVDPTTGLSTSNRDVIFGKYLRRFDGLIFDIISVLPIEVMPFLYYSYLSSFDQCLYLTFFYSNRLVRSAYFMVQILHQKRKLSVNIFVRWFTVLSYKIALLILVGCLHFFLLQYQRRGGVRCNFKLSLEDWEHLMESFLCVVNNYVGGGLFICAPEDITEIFITTLFAIWAVLSKAFLVNQVLTIMYATHYTKSDQMHKLEELEKYLSVREVSPAIFVKIRSYFCNLLDLNNEGAMPYFLKVAPDFIKVEIMQDLYINHFKNCYMFQGIGENFLKQLATRLERFIFFPGDYIVMKGDVDHNMYFVHKGEVFCIEHDEEYQALEKKVDLFIAGENFGVMQGLLPCCQHTFSYRAKTLADVLVLNHSNWEDLRIAFPKITEIINTKAAQYKFQGSVAL